MKRLSGRRILFLGSSVTYGSACQGTSFVEMLAEETGCTAVKEAVSGTTLADLDESSYVSRLKKLDPTLPADLFVCQLSTNDAAHGLPLGVPEGPGGAFDVRTVAGAMEKIVDSVQKTWKCPAMFYSNPRYDSPIYAQMVALMHKICELWKIECVDLWSDESFNEISEEDRRRWMADEIHPTLEGYRAWWLPRFEQKIFEILK